MSLNSPENYDKSRQTEKDFQRFLRDVCNDKYFAVCQSNEWQDMNEHWDVCATNCDTMKSEFFDIKIVEEKYRGNGRYTIDMKCINFLANQLPQKFIDQYHFVFPEYSSDGKETGKWLVFKSLDLINAINADQTLIYKQTTSYVVIDVYKAKENCLHEELENDIPF